MHCGARPHFAFVFDFASRRRTLNFQTHKVFARPWCASCHCVSAVNESTTGGSSRRSCIPCKMSCIVSRLSSPFAPGGLPLLRPSRPPQHGHRFVITLGLSRAVLLVLRLNKASYSSQPCIASLRPIRPRCLTVFRRLLLRPLIIILLISGFSRNTCAIIADNFGLSTGNNTLASSSAVHIALASALASFGVQPLRA